MGNKGSVTLGKVAARVTHIEVVCTRCERRGRYRLSRLVATHGDDFSMTDLGAVLADCPKRNESVGKRCDVYFPDLIKVMGGDDPHAETSTPRSGTDDDD
ncbi:hypothetical protein IAG25_15885 [Caballeronia sp. EK]|uniref:hypothetical protein n=1 Tax=Caballeronia sp. EK TaxID=2767469 RepID=UPI001654C477|nr:hypothetical protein [Caballeronia sp. EK]MBC8638301.1 hypothetical protein [Caballeronia sp. EK]